MLDNNAIINNNIKLIDIDPIDFYGVNNENLDALKKEYPDVKIVARGNEIILEGDPERIDIINTIINKISFEIKKSGFLDNESIIDIIQNISRIKHDGILKEKEEDISKDINLILQGVNGLKIKAKTPGQIALFNASKENDIVFALGPAGSGKSYTAVAIAVKALKEKTVKKIVLVRPAVEAGENLGFLPGNYKEKIDPYLRPLYDALEDMLNKEKLEAYYENNIIEIVPLAYMRGRTLNNAFIILDEAQNATDKQLKMFLTRMGVGSRIIITGDKTQVDLPRSQSSGFVHCVQLLQDIQGIAFVYLGAEDVLRHKLVKKIIAAYEKYEE